MPVLPRLFCVCSATDCFFPNRPLVSIITLYLGSPEMITVLSHGLLHTVTIIVLFTLLVAGVSFSLGFLHALYEAFVEVLFNGDDL